jgi:hypothetical protein
VAPQSGAKKYCTVYYITLNSTGENEYLKFLQKIVGDRVRSQDLCMSELSVNFLFFKGENYF